MMQRKAGHHGEQAGKHQVQEQVSTMVPGSSDGYALAAQPVLHPQCADTVAASGQNLVRVALVADIPDQHVLGGVEHMVQRNCQLDHTQPGPQMPARH